MQKKLRMMIAASLFTGITIASTFLRIPLPGLNMFLSLQVFIVILSGLLLGPLWGAVSQTVYVVLGLLGLPIFTQGGGLAYVMRPEFGYLLGFIAASAAAGFLYGKLRRGVWLRRFAPLLSTFGAIAVMYLVALPYIAALYTFVLAKEITVAHLWALFCAPFLLFDIAKGIGAAMIAPLVLRRFAFLSRGA